MTKPDGQFLDSVRAINKTYAERDSALVLSPALIDDKLINRLLVPETPATPAGTLRRTFAAQYEASRNIKGTASHQPPAPGTATPTPPPVA